MNKKGKAALVSHDSFNEIYELSSGNSDLSDIQSSLVMDDVKCELCT